MIMEQYLRNINALKVCFNSRKKSASIWEKKVPKMVGKVFKIIAKLS